MDGSDSLRLIRSLDLEALIYAQSLNPAEPLIVHRRKCKIQRVFYCTCRPTIVTAPARC